MRKFEDEDVCQHRFI